MVRLQVLNSDLLPSLSKILSIVLQEEKHQSIATMQQPNHEATTMAMKILLPLHVMLVYDHCHGHTKERCFKLIGDAVTW